MTNFEKIILAAVGALFVIVLLVGAIVLRQQKAINALSGSAAGISKQAAVQPSVQKKSPTLADIIKQFSGTVESVSGNQLTVNAKLTDFSKPKNPDKLKNADIPQNLSADDYEVLAKKIIVNTSIKTVFEKKPLVELKVGDAVYVNSDKSPYTSDTVTAEKITYIESPK